MFRGETITQQQQLSHNLRELQENLYHEEENLTLRQQDLETVLVNHENLSIILIYHHPSLSKVLKPIIKYY